MSAERRYTDEEVGAILRQASEPGARNLPAERDGMTLAELQSIAAEVGIDPRAVEAAARRLESTALAPKGSPIVGTPLVHQHEIVLDVPVREAQYPALIEAIRRAMGRQGVASAGITGLEWRARDAAGGRYVSIRPDGDRTIIRLLGNYRDGAVAWFAVGGVGGGMSILVMLKTLGFLVPAGFLLPLGLLPAAGAGYLTGRWLWKRRYRAEEREFADTLHAVTALLEAGARRPPED